MWKVELKERDEEYWKGKKERDDSLSRMLERRVRQSKIAWFLGIKGG